MATIISVSAKTRNGKEISGVITVKGDKVSYSIYCPSFYSPACRSSFKNLMKQVVATAPEFNHPSVKNIRYESNLVPKLISLLTEQTQSLKEQYLGFTKAYARSRYAQAEARKGWNEKRWLDEYSVKYTVEHSYGSEFLNVSNRSGNAYSTMASVRSNDCGILYLGYEKFLLKELNAAEEHYTNSIYKLAERIAMKNLDANNLRVKTSHINVNIDMEITDGVNTVKAWTIIAEGLVQRPHYRYLVK